MKTKRIFLLIAYGILTSFLSARETPVIFSTAREDSLQDLSIIKRYFSEEKISLLMIASSGCTAAKLVADGPVAALTLVDSNLAHLQLSKLKIYLLTLPSKKRQEILGYLPMKPEERKSLLLGLMQALDIKEETFGDIDLVAKLGLDFVGRCEKLFEDLRGQLTVYQKEIEVLFATTDVKQQVKQISSDTRFGQALDQAFNQAMSRENLIGVFGEKAQHLQEFSKCFGERIRVYLSKHLASSSPWLAHMLLGHFHKETVFPWLSSALSQSLPTMHYFHRDMNDALKQAPSEAHDVIHLSITMDWLTPSAAEETLRLAYRALKPGGIVIVRQLQSSINLSSVGKEFEWDNGEFLEEDRSFFYGNVSLGIKPRPSSAPQVKALADAILTEIPIINGSFFRALPAMTKEEFQRTQMQFFFAVDYFSRPMSALIARLPTHKDRIDILHNIVEEHGDFSIEEYHINTFQKFLNSIGISKEDMSSVQAWPIVDTFNYTLMGVSANEDPLIAIACQGMIEYAFADISAFIGQAVIANDWVKKEDLIHYGPHALIDKRHAEEFFKIVEPYMQDLEKRSKITSGLRLGAYLFNALYEDLYRESLRSL